MRFICVNNETGCWEFNGKLKLGYGVFKLHDGTRNGKSVLAHRYLYQIKNKLELNSKIFVCHKCDNRKCCNPDHMFIGTAKDNFEDMVSKKGSHLIQFGEKNLSHKLTTEQIVAIREDNRPIQIVAKCFNTCKSNVSYIRNFKSRKYG
jgi:hypothetical protein